MTDRLPTGAPADPRELPLYHLTEAAHYLHIPVSTLRGWIAGFGYRTKTGTRRAAPLIRLPEGPAPERLLSFFNLVEVQILSSLRRIHHIPMYKVRKVIHLARARKGSRHPLLHARPSSEGQDLVIDPETGSAENQNGQRVFLFAVERPFDRIEWDSRALPTRLYPFASCDDPEAPQRIVIDPERASGRPVIAGTTIPTRVVAERHRAGETVAALSAEYGLDPSSIEDAIRCEVRNAA